MLDERSERALELFREAYSRQMEGELDEAAALYRRSIALYPTAEAYTFLGWTYRFQGKIEAAIAECKHAILIDPTLGNPYNDIGAYLIELGRHQEAIPWLERAIAARRYDACHYAWFYVGRARFLGGELETARECFAKALELQPDYAIARRALDQLEAALR
jgi:tetratricopeptide (TPR) repeat protein